uniref:Uncharacterized protein n=1 Tax=Palpitomonas bilix TaxID=652834 RepID=A0A7S3GIF7_9EUKA|mmetsp:Transcript_50510/g.130186  ORF Transcript_50510/g.130186 Transcript_50510/m.130186 type:complete len:101 (+) Transcript_50510:65-367(+)
MQAQLALSKHGMKVDNILIGVMPCMNVEVFSSFREEGEDRGLESSLPLTESSSYRGWASGQRREGGVMVEDEPLQDDVFVKKPAVEDGCLAKILNYLFGV